MAQIYRAVESLVMVKTDNRQLAYVYQGQLAPSNTDPADAQRLVDEGYLVPVGDPQKAFYGAGSGGSPAGTPGAGVDLGGASLIHQTDNHGKAVLVEMDKGRLPGEDETGSQPVQLATDNPDPNALVVNSGESAQRGGRPKDYAPKAVWVEYAVAHREEGTSEDDARAEAEAMTKEQLIDRHGRAEV